MKVYSCPDAVPAPTPDFRNYDAKVEQKREEEHQVKLAEWLRANGYNGPYTGKIFSTPVADGHASYMVGDKGRSGILIHLPYGDAYSSRDVGFLPKSAIIARIESLEKMSKLFGTDADSDHGRWWAARKLGEIVHYSNGFGEFVRGEIVDYKGEKMMRPIALVGNWKAHDLPRIGSDGNLHEGHHVTTIRKGEPYRPNFSNMFEAGRVQGAKDPRGEPAIDLTPPKPNAEQVELKRLNDIRDKVIAALNGDGLFKAVELQERLVSVRKMLSVEL
jgi:hypothetical protein